jgi:hypothetical protein
VAFGLLNIYGPPIESFRHKGDPDSLTNATLSQRTSFVDRILIDLRDAYVSKLYYSVAQATLGRAFQPYYVPPYVDGAESAADRLSGRDGDTFETNPSFIVPVQPLLPWRDFLFEYPPGVLAVILFPSLFTADQDTYFRIFSLEMEALLTLAVFLSVRTADLLGASGKRVLAQSILLTVALGVIAVRRYDPSVAFAISATIYGLASRRPTLSGAAFAFSVALKGAPLVLAPVLALWFAARHDWKGFRAATASFALCGASATAIYLAVAGPRALDFVAYHANRPLQMESVYGAILMIVRFFAPDTMTIKHTYGSMNVISAAAPALVKVATITVMLGLGASYVWAFRRIRSAADDRERLVAVVNCDLRLPCRGCQPGEAFQSAIYGLHRPDRRARRSAIPRGRTLASRHRVRHDTTHLPVSVHGHCRRLAGAARRHSCPRPTGFALALAVQGRERSDRERQRGAGDSACEPSRGASPGRPRLGCPRPDRRAGRAFVKTAGRR